eukprot:symbB.v1.2.034361.t1/scaffold4422.1/size39833/1
MDNALLSQIFQKYQESGQLPVSRLGDAMRSAGMNPNEVGLTLERFLQFMQALPDVAVKPNVQAEPKDESYDLHDRKAFAKFLIDADIRLVRGRFFKKLYRDGLKLPRRQEADSMTVGLIPALVRHQEVEIWAEGKEVKKTRDLDDCEIAERKAARKAKIVAVSHVWESREHADPHGYQLRKLAEVVEADSWYFYDYVSLYQFKRNMASQEKSFRRAMANMHVLYAHEHSSTLRIETLTPSDEMHMDATVLVYHAPSDEVKPVPVADLIANRTAYRDRGWCIAELCWSSTRSLGALSKEIDEAEADTKGQAPMPPEIFVPLFKEKLQFTHRSDIDAVLKLQDRVFHEKAQKNEILKLEKLSRAEAKVAIEALQHYPALRRLDITGSRLGDVESFLLDLFKALDSKSSVTELCLADNELGLDVKGAMLSMRKVLDKNPPLSMLDLKNNAITEEGAKMLAEALLQRRDAALKIELDGNDFGAGVLILALALKFCQEQVRVVHPKVELLAESIEALEFDAEIAAGKKVTVTDLCRLTSLSMDCTHSQQDVAWQLAVVAGAFDTLQQLVKLRVNLSHISINDEGCHALGAEMSKLLQLTTLELSLERNNVRREGCQALGDGLCKLVHLTSLCLDLERNDVGDGGYQALGDGLCKLLQLTTLSLNLGWNRVWSQGCQALGDGIGKLLHLTTLSLDLGFNNVGGGGCRALRDGLVKLLHLTTLSLDLKDNNVGDGGCQALGDGLGKLLHLTTLSVNLVANNVRADGCQALGDGLCKLLQLTSLSLDLKDNNVGDGGCRALRDGLSKLLHLTTLLVNLVDNNVRADGCQALGDGLCKLLQLTTLELDLYDTGADTAEVVALREKLQHVPNLRIDTLDCSPR